MGFTSDSGSYRPLWGIAAETVDHGHWHLNVINSGSIASAFVPLEVLVRLESSLNGPDVGYHSLKRVIMSLQDSDTDEPQAGILVNPGESIDFDLFIDLEYVEEGTDWNTITGGAPEAQLTVRYLNLNRLLSDEIVLPLPSIRPAA